MRLNKYSEFILENSNTMMIFYSTEFRNILTKIALNDSKISPTQTIARILLSIENKDDIQDTYTLIDKTDKNDMISYVQTSRFYREFPEENLKKSGETFVKGSKFWKSGRTPQYSIGRWVRHVFNDVRKTPIRDKDLEEFVNDYKSTYDKMLNVSKTFEIVKGEDIRYWYLVDNYDEIRGQLGSSCMRYEKCQPYFDIYVQNPDVCSLLILKNGDKLIGRALLWVLTDGKKFMDRIYTIDDSDKKLFESYGDENGFLRDGRHEVKVKEGRYDYYPYMDNFTNYDYEKGILSTNMDGYKILILQNTDGSASDNEDRVWSDYHGEYIDEDDSRYCEDIDDYVHYECAVWLDYLGIYVSDNASTVYSEYTSDSYYSEDTVYSECMEDSLPIEFVDLIEFKVSDSGDTDYCTKEMKKYYMEIDGVYYSKKSYIKDPYTGEYNFRDKVIDGNRYDKSLESKLESEFEVDDKYTLSDGSFDFDKYTKDLKDLLIKYKPSKDFIDKLTTPTKSGEILGVLNVSCLLPGLYAWIIRSQKSGSINVNYQTSGALANYKNQLSDIISDMPDDIFDVDKNTITSFYVELFNNRWQRRNLFEIYDNIDISTFPTEIYKRILLLNI